VTELAALRAVLVPYPAERMIAHPVSPAVNHGRNDGPQLIPAFPAQGTVLDFKRQEVDGEVAYVA
jgi:hypothetical protein